MSTPTRKAAQSVQIEDYIGNATAAVEETLIADCVN
jgi:hypothetical protein